MGIEELSPVPGRPDHPDFWALSDIILKMDGAVAEARTEDEKNAAWQRFFHDIVDTESLIYMGFQRAMRALGITTAGEVRRQNDLVTKMATLYAEAFAVGIEYSKR